MLRALVLALAVEFCLVAAAPIVSAAEAPQPVVFVPYDRTAGPRLDPRQSVLLPYADFLRLQRVTTGTQERAMATLVQADYKGAVEDKVARFDATLRLEALAPTNDPVRLDLPLEGAAIESLAIQGAPATIATRTSGQGLRLLLRGGGMRTLTMRLAVPVATDGASARIDFRPPRAAASSLSLHLADAAIVEPLPGSIPASVKSDPRGGVTIEGSPGIADRILLAWRPRVEPTGVAARGRVAIAEQMRVTVTNDTAQASDKLRVTLLGGGISAVTLRLPEGAQLVNVSGSFVRTWSSSKTGDTTVALVREVTEPFDLSLEVQLAKMSGDRLVIPAVTVPGAVSHQGTVTIIPMASLTIWPEQADGLEQVAVSAGEPAASRAFSFSQPGWKLVLSRRPKPARVQADGLLLYEMAGDLLRIKTDHRFTIAGSEIFDAVFEVPEGCQAREAGPPEVVAGFRQQGRRVEVNFRGMQIGKAQVKLVLERPRAAGQDKLLLEPVRVIGADEDAGRLIVAAPPAWRVSELTVKGLEATDVRLLQQRLQGMLGSDLAPVLAYSYFNPVFSGQLALERQRTRLSCDTAVLATVMPSLMRIDANLNYLIEFSATDQLQLMLPARIGEDARFGSPDIKEKSRAPMPASGDGMTTWTIRLQRQVIGPYRLAVSFDVPLAEAGSGKPIIASVPPVRAAGVTRETGSVAVARRENLEVRVAEVAEALEPRDVKDLPASLGRGFLGFRYFDPSQFKLKLELIRHESEKVLGALIRRMHIETVLSQQREAMHEATLEVQNQREQYLELALPQGMEIWLAQVAGATVRPVMRQDNKAQLIELSKSSTADGAMRVRLILRQKLGDGDMGSFGRLRFEPPRPVNIPVLRTTWKLYLPRDYRFLGFGGTMRLESGGEPPWIEPTAETVINDLPQRLTGAPSQNPPQAVEPAAYNSAETDQEKQARAAGTSLDIPLVREGQIYELSKLSGVGDIRVQYWKRKPLLIMQGLIGIAMLAGLLLAMRRRRGWAIPLGAVAVTFILASLSGGFIGRMMATALAASIVALAIAILRELIAHSRKTTPPPAVTGEGPTAIDGGN
ncbi:hypothetical protein LLG95_01110 [bacterium]|nr:hypothetical protein [bacterium]